MYRTVLNCQYCTSSRTSSYTSSFHKHRRMCVHNDDLRCTFKCRSARLQLVNERESTESLNRESDKDSVRIVTRLQQHKTETKTTPVRDPALSLLFVCVFTCLILCDSALLSSSDIDIRLTALHCYCASVDTKLQSRVRIARASRRGFFDGRSI